MQIAKPRSQVEPYIRFVNQSDIDACEELELYTQHLPNTASMIDQRARHVRVVSLLVEDYKTRKLHCYWQYDATDHRAYRISRFAWDDELCASAAIYRWKAALYPTREFDRTFISVRVCEYDLPTQRLLKRHGFVWAYTAKDERTGIDTYIMRFTRP